MAVRLEQLQGWLTKQGYKNDTVIKEIEKVHLVERKDLLEKRLKEKTDDITLVFTYTRHWIKFMKLLEKHIGTY